MSPPKPAVGLRAVDTGTKTIPTIVVPSGEFNDPTTTILPISEAPPSIIATTVLTQTTASEFFGGNAEFEVESDSGQTQTSYATSVGHEGSLSIPSLPKESQGGKPFECPYCFTIISVKNSHSWKKHIFRGKQIFKINYSLLCDSSRVLLLCSSPKEMPFEQNIILELPEPLSAQLLSLIKYMLSLRFLRFTTLCLYFRLL